MHCKLRQRRKRRTPILQQINLWTIYFIVSRHHDRFTMTWALSLCSDSLRRPVQRRQRLVKRHPLRSRQTVAIGIPFECRCTWHSVHISNLWGQRPRRSRSRWTLPRTTMSSAVGRDGGGGVAASARMVAQRQFRFLRFRRGRFRIIHDGVKRKRQWMRCRGGAVQQNVLYFAKTLGEGLVDLLCSILSHWHIPKDQKHSATEGQTDTVFRERMDRDTERRRERTRAGIYATSCCAAAHSDSARI